MSDAPTPTLAPVKRFRQFRLLTLFVVMLLVCIPLSWFARRAARLRARAAAEQRVTELRGWVYRGGYDIRRNVWEDESLLDIGLLDTQVTDDDLKLFQAFSDEPVIHLDLMNTQIGDAGLAHLKSLKNVDMLWLAGTRVTRAGIEAWDALPPDIRARVLAEQRLTELGGRFERTLVSSGHSVNFWSRSTLTISLDGTAVTDNDMKLLREFLDEGFQIRLDVTNTSVSDAGLEPLKGYERLQLLRYTGSKITPEGFERLKRSIPRLESEERL
jgi:hypothetical protein